MHDTGAVVNVRRSTVKMTHRHGVAFTKRTFPLVAGYACTAHKAQGATYRGRVILHCRAAFVPGIVFVMCSRVTDRTNLFILDGLTAADFVPVGIAQPSMDLSDDEDDDEVEVDERYDQVPPLAPAPPLGQLSNLRLGGCTDSDDELPMQRPRAGPPRAPLAPAAAAAAAAADSDDEVPYPYRVQAIQR